MAQTDTGSATDNPAAMPLLKLGILSHGTVECHDLGRARRFYTEMLGFEVVQTSASSMMLRHGSDTIIACVETKGETAAGIYSHFGLDVESEDKVDQAHGLVTEHQERYGIQKITKPVHQHGTYSFYLIDADGNWWEILKNPKGGYNYVFELKETRTDWRQQEFDSGRQRRWEQQNTQK